MATQGPLYPGTAISAAVHAPEDDDAWVNPTNVGADDGAESTITAASFDTPDISRQLYASQFGFTIPDGSTIDGILVEIQRRASTAPSSASDHRVQLTTAENAFVGDNKALTTTDWPLAATTQSYGGSADTWNASPTVAMVNASGFGVTLSAQADEANADIQVDFIRITITYTPPPAADNRVEVSWAELETPNPNNRIEVSWAELEVPTPNNRVEVSWVELEVPTPNNRIELSWAEFEVPSLGPEDNRVEVAWVEFEVPSPNNRLELSWAEFEVPTPDNRLELAWAEFEVPTPGNRIELAWAELEVPDVGAAPTYAEVMVTKKERIYGASTLDIAPMTITIPQNDIGILEGEVTVTKGSKNHDSTRGRINVEVSREGVVLGRAVFLATEWAAAHTATEEIIFFPNPNFLGPQTLTLDVTVRSPSTVMSELTFDVHIVARLASGD